jgi:hypothetical protein
VDPRRLRPTGIKPENLALWLSGVINDAIRDATEAGLSETDAVLILRSLDKMWGGRYVRNPFEKKGRLK